MVEEEWFFHEVDHELDITLIKDLISTKRLMEPAPYNVYSGHGDLNQYFFQIIMQQFSDLAITPLILSALKKLNLIEPTPIQTLSIPLALDGKDLLGTAQTGTGKTYAFGIPLVNHLTLNKDSCALILTPTRELALQVLKALKDLTSNKNNLDSALIIGGDSIQKQLRQ